MENQLDLKSKSKNQLKKLKYIEINIKNRCSISNIAEDDIDLTSDCYYNNYPFPNFLYNYLYYDVFNPNPIERIISLNYKQEDYVYNLTLEDIPKGVFFSKKINDFHFYNDIRCLIGDWDDDEYCEKNGKKMLILSLNFLLRMVYMMVKVLKKLLLSLKTSIILKNANFQFLIRLCFQKYLNQRPN
nr:hypothetical protein [Mesomycoplasma ovipneumoniae]